MNSSTPFRQLDHIAIVVRDTEEALKFYRDQLGLPLVLTELIEDVGVRLTHLDLGGIHLQLVQPIRADHPLHQYLWQHGESLHHLCFRVPDVPAAVAALPALGLRQRGQALHRGPNGRRAAFVDPADTHGIQLEFTG